MARSFNGTTDKIVTTATGITGTGARAFSFWFKTAATTGTNSNVALGYGGTSAAGTRWNISIESGVIWNRLISAAISWGSGYNDNNWHHLLMTVAASASANGILTYVDGTSLSIASQSGGTTSISTGTTNPVCIGIDSSGGSLNFSGILAEVCIWNAQLTAQEAAALALRVNARRIRPASIVNYWPLFGLSSAEPDLSGNAKNGTLTGTSAASHAPVTPFTKKTNPGVSVASTTTFFLPKPIVYRPRFEPAFFE